VILLYQNFDSTWKETYHDGLPLRLKRVFFMSFLLNILMLCLRKVNAARNSEPDISEPSVCKHEIPYCVILGRNFIYSIRTKN
jgi:hypothetical protein